MARKKQEMRIESLYSRWGDKILNQWAWFLGLLRFYFGKDTAIILFYVHLNCNCIQLQKCFIKFSWITTGYSISKWFLLMKLFCLFNTYDVASIIKFKVSFIFECTFRDRILLCGWDYYFLSQVNPHTHQVKLCDFGSAKVLVCFGVPSVHLHSMVFWSLRAFLWCLMFFTPECGR